MSLPSQRSNSEEGASNTPIRDNPANSSNANNERLSKSVVVHIKEGTHLTSTETECDVDQDESVRLPTFRDNIEVCEKDCRRLEIPEVLISPAQNASGEAVTDGRANTSTRSNDNSRKFVPAERNHCTALIPYQPSNDAFSNTQSFCSQNILINKMEHNVPTRPITEELNCSEEELTRTITINISETPSSTAMHRPPLRERMVGVLTNAINFCLCSPFVKDCVVILGMYIGFSILIFLLTLVSYNFLRTTILQYRTEPRQHFCQYRQRQHFGQHP